MAVAPANTWGTNWQSGVQGAGQKYRDGVQNTTVDVAGKAIAQQGALLANFSARVNDGTWARRLAAVGTSGWKSASVAKAANYETGATAGKPKYDAFASQAQPVWSQLSSAIEGMPSGGKGNALARVGAWIDGMSAFRAQYTP